MSEVYCETMNKLRRLIKKTSAGCSLKVSFSCTTMRSPTPRLAQMLSNALIRLFNWEIFDHPPYSPDLAPSDYHLFIMMVWLATQHFHTNRQLMDGVNNWPHNLASLFFDEWLQKLVSWYKKCLNVDSNYVEK